MVLRLISCLIFLLLLQPKLLKAQRIDHAYLNELTRKAQSGETDAVRISAFQLIAQFYNDKYYVAYDKADLHKALKALDRAAEIANRIKSDKDKIETIWLKAFTYLGLKDTINAEKHITDILNFYEAHHDFKKELMMCQRFAAIAYSWRFNNITLAYCQKALLIAKAHNLPEFNLWLRTYSAFSKTNLGDVETALKEAIQIVADYSSKHQNLTEITGYIASTYRYKGDLRLALKYALASLKDVEQYKDTINDHNAYGELALIYEALGKTDKSIFYFRKTLEVRDKRLIPDVFRFRTLGFIIKGLIKLGRASEALKEAILYETEHPPFTEIGKAYCAQNKAYCYEALNNFPKAEKYYERMINLMTDWESGELLSLAYYDISWFYLKTGKYVQAQKYASKILAESSLENYKNFEYLHFKVDSATGNYHSALTHFSNYQNAKDSLFNESKSREINELQLKYETAQRENDIALLKKDAQLQRDQLKQAGRTRNLTFAGVIFLLVSMGLLYNSYRINIKKTREIDEKNISLNNLVEEKEWLMKEIHHRVKNNLQIVMGLLQRQSSYINNTAALKAIKNSEHRIHAIALIHQKLYQSADLTLINMQEYIEELLNHLKETTDAESRIVFIKDIEEIYLHVAQAVPLGLIINEAVTNAIKYAYPGNGAGKIRIMFTQKDNDENQLLIEDEGIGITENVNGKSMGMNLMKGLTKQLGGKLDFVNKAGLSIRITFNSSHAEAPA